MPLDPALNSLGFAKPPSETRVVVAMSGGVDSSVVAALAAASGAEVIGITLQLYDYGAATGRKGACCAGDDIRDARQVADRLGIAHYVYDHESAFREEVVETFADEYLAGRTPIPCIRCNMGPKFTDLLRMARELGADCLATGHYVRRVGSGADVELHRALDPARDQSYFLFATTSQQLDYLRFPLGHLPSKNETRVLAEKYGLKVANKPDSQDICFVPNGNYAAVIEKLRPGAADPGEIVHADGRVYLNETQQRFDAAVMDAFSSSSVPAHLATRETFARLRDIVDGPVYVNLLDAPDGPLARGVHAILTELYPHVVVAQGPVSERNRANVLFAAAAQPLDAPVDQPEGYGPVRISDARAFTDDRGWVGHR